MNPIFAITAIQDDNYFIHGISRVFGWKETLETARATVRNNVGDLHECRYKLIVIEEVYPGIHPMIKNEYWYQHKDGEWESCDKPDKFESVYNFGIG